jgi:lysozyme
MAVTPRVIDISHHNEVYDFKMVAAAGVWGVIHKATQGKAYADPNYPGRRILATNAGLLWGAYHFNTGDDVKAQVRWFIDKAKPDDKTLLVLDYEDNRLSNMNIHQAVEFLHRVEDMTGRKAAIYSGNRLKESIDILNSIDRDYLTSHRLWLCQYGPVAKVPRGFAKWWLWQYTGDGIGPLPHSVPGIESNTIDINTFQGTREELSESWSGFTITPRGDQA